MFHKSENLKNAVSERWCSDSRKFSMSCLTGVVMDATLAHFFLKLPAYFSSAETQRRWRSEWHPFIHVLVTGPRKHVLSLTAVI